MDPIERPDEAGMSGMDILKTVLLFGLWMFSVFVCAVFADPGITPARPNFLAILLGAFILVAGSHILAGRCPYRPVFFISGCIGSLLFLPTFLPDRRYFLGQTSMSNAAGIASDWTYTICCIAGVLYCGLVCRFAAYWRHRMANEVARRLEKRCTTCGYLLDGLLEPRCPECGTPFDAAMGNQPTSGPGEGQ